MRKTQKEGRVYATHTCEFGLHSLVQTLPLNRWFPYPWAAGGRKKTKANNYYKGGGGKKKKINEKRSGERTQMTLYRLSACPQLHLLGQHVWPSVPKIKIGEDVGEEEKGREEIEE